MAGPEAFLRVVETESRTGTREDPNGSNSQKYGREYGWDRVPWCAQFVWWCLLKSGNGRLAPKTASVPVMLGWARARGYVDHVPTPGALACYDWGGDGTPDHVGVVVDVTGPHTFNAVEGNTSPDDGGSQSNGDGVYLRTRHTQQVAGFIHLPWPAEEDDMPTVEEIAEAVARRVWDWPFPTGAGKPPETAGARLVAAARGLALIPKLDAIGAIVTGPPAVDYARLAAAVVDGIGGARLDADALARAVCDEQDRRALARAEVAP